MRNTICTCVFHYQFIDEGGEGKEMWERKECRLFFEIFLFCVVLKFFFIVFIDEKIFKICLHDNRL